MPHRSKIRLTYLHLKFIFLVCTHALKSGKYKATLLMQAGPADQRTMPATHRMHNHPAETTYTNQSVAIPPTPPRCTAAFAQTPNGRTASTRTATNNVIALHDISPVRRPFRHAAADGHNNTSESPTIVPGRLPLPLSPRNTDC